MLTCTCSLNSTGGTITEIKKNIRRCQAKILTRNLRFALNVAVISHSCKRSLWEDWEMLCFGSKKCNLARGAGHRLPRPASPVASRHVRCRTPCLSKAGRIYCSKVNTGTAAAKHEVPSSTLLTVTYLLLYCRALHKRYTWKQSRVTNCHSGSTA
jgi:hypothetical protein